MGVSVSSWNSVFGVACLALSLTAAGCTDTTNNYLTSIDTSELECSDGVDNDGDGAVDLADPGCLSNPLGASEAEDPACSDGIDNDGDTFIDFPNDPECSTERDGREDV